MSNPQQKTIRTDPGVLEHSLNQYFPDLLQFESLAAAESSDVYKKMRETIEEGPEDAQDPIEEPQEKME